MTQPQQGLYPKFEVTRTDGDPTGKHANCRHFVIDVNHDLVGQSALLIYAASIDNPKLSADLMALLMEITGSESLCGLCHRKRTPADFDYTPTQPIFGRPLGWYSGDDGELCPECMTKTVRGEL